MFKKMFSLFVRKSRQNRRPPGRWELDRTLLCFGKDASISIGNVCEGIFVTGGTGSGKTSGPGQLFAKTFLNAGFGGLVLAAKESECQLWRDYAAATGRLKDLIMFGPDEPHRLNFLDFEISRGGRGAGLTENIVSKFTTIIEVTQKSAGKSGQGGEQYWVLATKQMIRNIIDLLIVARGRVSIPEMYRVAISAPTSLEQIQNQAWKQRSFCFQCLAEADKKPKTPEQEEDFALVADYFMVEMPSLSEKTRSVILSSFTSMADLLNRGILKTLFCSDTNVTPQDIEHGKIIVINTAVKEFSEVGLVANLIWKNSFQHSIERRDVNLNPRPVFLWQDEAQLFWTEAVDNAFQSTARSSRVANMVMTQSISSFYAVAGEGQKGKSQVDSLVGNLNLKLACGNSDAVTNLWWADLCGKSRQYFFNGSSSNQNEDAYGAIFGGGGHQSSGGYSEQMEYDVNPNTFLQMRAGGPRNRFLVDALMFSATRQFRSTGKNYLPVTFRQR